MSIENNTTEASVVASFAAAAVAREFDAGMQGQFAVVPDGFRVESLERFQNVPNRQSGNLTVSGAEGFIGYVNRFGGAATLIVADIGRAKVKAVLDHGSPDTAAGFSGHTITIEPQHSEALRAWLAIEGKPMSQRALAEFLEERATDVLEPDAAAIMDMVLTFEAVKKVSFRSAVRLSNGDRQLTYVEDTTGGGSQGAVTIPERIIISAPLFEGMAPEDVRFNLRYRLDDGSVTFTLKMHRRDDVLRGAFDQLLHELDEDIIADVPRPFLKS